MAESRHLGASQPIFYQEPEPSDLELSEKLENYITEQDVLETLEGLDKRNALIAALNQLAARWVLWLASALKDVDALKHGTKVMPFGGHLLGVIMKDSDLDAVCIVPRYVRREEFYTSFPALLKEEGEKLSRLRVIEGARVPIISFCYCGYEVDLCLAVLTLDQVPPDLEVMDDTLMESMDITSIRSLNGVRETQAVLNLVPTKKTFLTAVVAVKLWAKRHGVHSSPCGYPGGIAWAIMVARLQQMYPNAAAATLLHKLFTVFTAWVWPRPVSLTELSKADPYRLSPWNPKVRHADTYHVMPVITPAYPQKNCAFTVTKSALRITTQQLRTGAEIMERIERGKCEWASLFEHINFFSMYKHFIMVTAKAASEQTQLDWSGLVVTRLRLFVETLEKQSCISLVHLSPTPRHLHSIPLSTTWFMGLQFHPSHSIKLSLAAEVDKFKASVCDTARERRLYQPDMNMDIKHIRRKEVDSLLLPGL